jgi:hypothetical protein
MLPTLLNKRTQRRLWIGLMPSRVGSPAHQIAILLTSIVDKDGLRGTKSEAVDLLYLNVAVPRRSVIAMHKKLVLALREL